MGDLVLNGIVEPIANVAKYPAVILYNRALFTEQKKKYVIKFDGRVLSASKVIVVPDPRYTVVQLLSRMQIILRYKKR